MSEQKFKRGNRVRLKWGHVVYEVVDGETRAIDISKERVGKEAVIIGSYHDLYGGGNFKDYSVTYLEDGCRESWKSESQLEFIDEGGEHLFEEAKINREKRRQENIDPKNISKDVIKGDGISSESVLHLFKILGYTSPGFGTRGEFFSLYADWMAWKPVILGFVVSKTYEEAIKGIEDKFLKMYNFEALYNFLHE